MQQTPPQLSPVCLLLSLSQSNYFLPFHWRNQIVSDPETFRKALLKANAQILMCQSPFNTKTKVYTVKFAQTYKMRHKWKHFIFGIFYHLYLIGIIGSRKRQSFFHNVSYDCIRPQYRHHVCTCALLVLDICTGGRSHKKVGHVARQWP